MLFANIERNWKDRRYGNSFRANYRFEKQYSRSAEVAASEFFRNELYAGRNSLDSMARRNLLYTHSLSASVDLKDTPLRMKRPPLCPAISPKAILTAAAA